MIKTKIICTLGPSTKTKEAILGMKQAGMSCARINTAHGDFRQYADFLKLTKKHSMPVILDLKGPDIRVKLEKPLNVRKKQRIKFFRNKPPCFNYDIIGQLRKNDPIFFDNGLIKSAVKLIEKNFIELEFYEDAVILENKGVNVPNRMLDVPDFTAKDIEAIKFAEKNRIEFLALSFVRCKDDVLRLKEKANSQLIISKIESSQGMKNLKGIIGASDGIMIARGDLAVEIGKEKVPIAQKQIILACNEAGKPCIVATQMLESMTNSKEPTRAEVSDVANAVMDGADAVMLSGETSTGKNPVNVVKTMNSIAFEADSHVIPRQYCLKNDSEKLVSAASSLINQLNITKTICLTHSGYTANILARQRTGKPIIAITANEKAFALLKLSWGVSPFLMKIKDSESNKKIISDLKKKKLLSGSDKVLILRNNKEPTKKATNSIEIYDVKGV